MTLREFIRRNREEIDAAVARLMRIPKTASCDCYRSGTDHEHEPKPQNDDDRRLWILNDEGLYDWARSEGANP